MQSLPNEKRFRALTAALYAVGLALPSLAVAAERDPVLEVMQALCIQEGMLRGFAGEALKGYVDACAAARRNVSPPELKQFSADPGAC